MADWRWLLFLTLPGLLGMRDPFVAPEDTCRAGELPLWHYRGWVDAEGQPVGIMLSPSGKWLRVKEGQRLAAHWTVSTIAAGTMDITLSAECEPSHWRWLKEGTTDDPQEPAAVDAADNHSRSEG
ncbi:DUF2531 family protein [Enterobacteriaceae bacterium 89]|nr:DUF2531 family protein [Enterobacteriaceae bacterium 89]